MIQLSKPGAYPSIQQCHTQKTLVTFCPLIQKPISILNPNSTVPIKQQSVQNINTDKTSPVPTMRKTWELGGGNNEIGWAETKFAHQSTSVCSLSELLLKSFYMHSGPCVIQPFHHSLLALHCNCLGTSVAGTHFISSIPKVVFKNSCGQEGLTGSQPQK
ncbi:hypothetical protein BaRGS_00019923 [Batillaria attramentaria]|uniref:Uncharacterized protein n=1 Tax=Batillaria attramentaria TaxID=370345 RepID=A0ABD0KPE4_9CAEN